MGNDLKAWALRELRDATSDRPAHAQLLEDLIAWRENGCQTDQPHDRDGRSGVPYYVAIDLAADVGWAYDDNRVMGIVPALQYPHLRWVREVGRHSRQSDTDEDVNRG